jgi:predicted nuclease of predicted toxin-antitoxin system
LRFLLDAHVSGPEVGSRLRAAGHDVRALDQEPDLEGLDDEDVLTLAREDQRILITHDISDFPGILRDWATEQRSHPGVILVYGIDHREFDLVVHGVGRWLDLHPQSDAWTDLAAVLDRAFATSRPAPEELSDAP